MERTWQVERHVIMTAEACEKRALDAPSNKEASMGMCASGREGGNEYSK